MKLLIDMNLSPRWVPIFGRSSIEAKHWSTIGRPDAPDSELMTYALEHDHIVMTQDLDFSAILAASG